MHYQMITSMVPPQCEGVPVAPVASVSGRLRLVRSNPIWPERGQHFLALYDNESVVVCQAFNPAIADYACMFLASSLRYSTYRHLEIDLKLCTGRPLTT